MEEAAASPAPAEEEEVYTPYEHLRTIKEDSDFFAIEPQIDLERDILSQSKH